MERIESQSKFSGKDGGEVQSFNLTGGDDYRGEPVVQPREKKEAGQRQNTQDSVLSAPRHSERDWVSTMSHVLKNPALLKGLD